MRMVGKNTFYKGIDLWDPELLRSNSEMKFWGNPDLVLHLLPFMEVDTILALASMHSLTRELLRRRFIWRQLLERTKMTQERLLACKSLEEYCDTMLDMGKEAEALNSLLNVLDPDEERDDLEMEALRTICRRFPGVDKTTSSQVFDFVNNRVELHLHEDEVKMEEEDREMVCVSSEGLTLISISVSYAHFTVTGVQMYHMLMQPENIKTINDMVEYQEVPIKRLEASQVLMDEPGMALLLGNCESWQVQVLAIPKTFGGEDWARLATRVRETKPENSSFNFLGIDDRKGCRKASRDDLKVVWQSSRQGCIIKDPEVEGHIVILNNSGWEGIDRVLDMCLRNF